MSQYKCKTQLLIDRGWSHITSRRYRRVVNDSESRRRLNVDTRRAVKLSRILMLSLHARLSGYLRLNCNTAAEHVPHTLTETFAAQNVQEEVHRGVYADAKVGNFGHYLDSARTAVMRLIHYLHKDTSNWIGDLAD